MVDVGLAVLAMLIWASAIADYIPLVLEEAHILRPAAVPVSECCAFLAPWPAAPELGQEMPSSLLAAFVGA